MQPLSLPFQLRLLVLFCLDKIFYRFSKPYLQKDFFQSLLLQWIYDQVSQYESTYHSMPTRIVIEDLVAKDAGFIVLPEEESFFREFLALLSSGNVVEAAYIKEQFIKFVKASATRVLLHKHAEDLDKGELEGFLSDLRHQSIAFKVSGNKLRDDHLFSLMNLAEIYENRGGIQTGIRLLDDVVGGLMPKELSLILADTNVGKSLLLTYMGGQALRQRKKVLHVTLEMSLPRTLMRYFATLSEPEDEIVYDNILKFYPEEKVYYYVDKLKEKYEGMLQLEEFPTGKCTINDIYAMLDKYPGIELIIVDYLDLLKPERRRNELRFEHSDLIIGLRGIASEAQIHLATATQANRTAVNKRLIGKEVTGEDYGKMRVADIGIGMGQSKRDAIKKEAVLYLTRSRNSDKHIADRYFIDFQHMSLRLIGQENIDGDEFE